MNPAFGGYVLSNDHWLRWSPLLAPAYNRHASAPWNLRFALVTRAISQWLPNRPCRIIDVGGGYGRQAISLARLGHEVVIMDPDPQMLDLAFRAAESEDRQVRARLTFVQGSGENAARMVGTGFDLACCHSVLMYVPDPAPMVTELTRLVSPGGLISILALNADSIAMRKGLQGRWAEALSIFSTGVEIETDSIPYRSDKRDDLIACLTSHGAKVAQWYGVKIFTDHLDLTSPIANKEEFETLLELEWVAGLSDPYRQIARTFHLIATLKEDEIHRGEKDKNL